MRQAQFVERHADEWARFTQWLDMRADSPTRARRTLGWTGIRDEDVPARYRRLCHQLALARRRGYSPLVTDRLQDLMQRGHTALYRPAPPRARRALEFLLAGFPRLVRAQRGCLWVSAALFAGAVVGMYVAVQLRPELIHSVFDAKKIAEFEGMYDPAAPAAKLGRDGGTDLQMFGYYIANNISIGFRTFASGLLFGIGTVVVLVMNGLLIGGVASHLQSIGNGDPFWRFVAGHSPFELTAIVISGAAGLRLGLDLIAPGKRRRIDALISGGRVGGLLCVGIFAMLLAAAFIEAFWSSIGWMPAWIKYSVGGVLWALVLGWLWRGGRGDDVHAAASQRATQAVDDAARAPDVAARVHDLPHAAAAIPHEGMHGKSSPAQPAAAYRAAAAQPDPGTAA